MSASPRVIGLVLTLNEARRLPDCLRSLALVTEHVIVLDSGSTDATREIAERHGATVVVRAFDGYANQRNAALELAAATGADWALFLDADERLTQAGARELREALAEADETTAAFWLPRRNLCFGRALRGGGWWPDEQSRVLRPSRARYDAARPVHEVAWVSGASRRLTQPLLHHNYATRREFARKQRGYTRLRVRAALASGAIPRRRAYLSMPARELWRRFITLRGYRDGLTGLVLASVLALEEWRACWAIRRGARS